MRNTVYNQTALTSELWKVPFVGLFGCLQLACMSLWDIVRRWSAWGRECQWDIVIPSGDACSAETCYVSCSLWQISMVVFCCFQMLQPGTAAQYIKGYIAIVVYGIKKVEWRQGSILQTFYRAYAMSEPFVSILYSRWYQQNCLGARGFSLA